LVPAGCIECHGNHLPVGTDTLIAEAVARGVAERLDGVVAPTIDYGPTGYAVSGPERGTVDVAAEAFYGYAKAVLDGLVRLGFRAVFVVVHHQGPDGPEASAFHLAGAALFNELHLSRGPGWWGERRPEPAPVVRVVPTILPDVAAQVRGDHAGRTETSLLLALAPDHVDLGTLRRDDFWYAWSPGRESRDGTAEHGRTLLGLMVESVAGEIARSLPAVGGGTER
ncbi:MAG TPA: creatininase family protein, partial [Kribbellaceae bacterium]